MIGLLKRNFSRKDRTHITFAGSILALILVVGACSSDSPQEPNINQSNVSDDPAITDVSLALNVSPGWLYEGLATERLSQTNCSITQNRDPNDPADWVSLSECEKHFDAENGRMQPHAFSHVNAKICDTSLGVICPPNTYYETVTTRTSLMREFEVTRSGSESVSLIGSSIWFDASWFGRIIGTAPQTVGSYEISFRLRDLTEGNLALDEQIAFNSKSGTFKLIAVKGVPIPLVLPQWSRDEFDGKVIARPLPLKSGHRYRISLTIELIAKGSLIPPYDAFASFGDPLISLPGVDLGGWDDPGFIEWKNIRIQVGLEP